MTELSDDHLIRAWGLDADTVTDEDRTKALDHIRSSQRLMMITKAFSADTDPTQMLRHLVEHEELDITLPVPRFETPNDAVKAMRQMVKEMHDSDPETQSAWGMRLCDAWEWLDGYLSAAGRLPVQWTAERSVMLCIRDPDESNQFVGDGEPVAIYDCDMGRMDLDDESERAEWLENQELMAADIRTRGAELCADALDSVIAVVKERDA